MQFDMTAAELIANPEILAKLYAKDLKLRVWDSKELSHVEFQWLLDNDKNITLAVLYSPVMPQSTLDAFVPLGWPGQPVDEYGETVSMTYGEYLRVTEVVGGYVLQFANGPKDAKDNIRLPSNSKLRAQIIKAGGFLTQSEVDAIKIIPEAIE